jgi:hypothetical protein
MRIADIARHGIRLHRIRRDTRTGCAAFARGAMTLGATISQEELMAVMDIRRILDS